VKTANTPSATAIFAMKTSLDTFNDTFRDVMANPPPVTISLAGSPLPLGPHLPLPPPPLPLASPSAIPVTRSRDAIRRFLASAKHSADSDRWLSDEQIVKMVNLLMTSPALSDTYLIIAAADDEMFTWKWVMSQVNRD